MSISSVAYVVKYCMCISMAALVFGCSTTSLVTVRVVDKSTNIPVEDAEVLVGYTPKYKQYLFTESANTISGITDDDGVVILQIIRPIRHVFLGIETPDNQLFDFNINDEEVLKQKIWSIFIPWTGDN